MEEFCECQDWDCGPCLCKCYRCSLTYEERMRDVERDVAFEKNCKDMFYPQYPLD